MRLIRGYEAFKETNFAHVFLFINYDVFVQTVSILIKVLFVFRKVLIPLPKFNSSF